MTALSADGTFAVGWTNILPDKVKVPHAAIWETSKNTVNYFQNESSFNALSADGKVIGGWALDQDTFRRAVVGRYVNGNKKEETLFLRTLKYDNSGASTVSALSADGTVAGGWADTDHLNPHAAIWIYENGTWSATDLGTLSSDASGKSVVTALSADGTVAGGWSEENYDAEDIRIN